MSDNRNWANHLRPLKPLPTGMIARVDPSLRVSAIMFDTYGTLLMSSSGDIDHPCSPQQNHRLVELLRRYQIDSSVADLQHRLNATIKGCHYRAKQEGIDFPEIDILCIWPQLLPQLEEPVLRRFAVEYELIHNPVHPMPGLKHLLYVCRKRRMLMGIISNAQFYTPLILEWLLGSSLKNAGFDIDLIFFSYRLRRAKPSPLLFGQAAKALTSKGTSLKAVLYVGNDMRKDIAPACRQGFKTALFAGDRRSLRLRAGDALCRGIQPNVIITRLTEIQRYLA